MNKNNPGNALKFKNFQEKKEIKRKLVIKKTVDNKSMIEKFTNQPIHQPFCVILLTNPLQKRSRDDQSRI